LNICGYTGPIFAIFSPYESSLGADGDHLRTALKLFWTCVALKLVDDDDDDDDEMMDFTLFSNV